MSKADGPSEVNGSIPDPKAPDPKSHDQNPIPNTQPSPWPKIPTTAEIWGKSAFVGAGGFSVVTIAAALANRNSAALQLGSIAGVAITLMDGLMATFNKRAKERAFDQAEARRMMIAAEHDETERKLKSTLLRHQECIEDRNRIVRECAEERRRLAEEKRQLAERVERLEARVDTIYDRAEKDIDKAIEQEHKGTSA